MLVFNAITLKYPQLTNHNVDDFYCFEQQKKRYSLFLCKKKTIVKHCPEPTALILSPSYIVISSDKLSLKVLLENAIGQFQPILSLLNFDLALPT